MRILFAVLLLLPAVQGLTITGHPCDTQADLVANCDATGTPEDPFLIQDLQLTGAATENCPNAIHVALLNICDSPYHIVLSDAQIVAQEGLAMYLANADVTFSGEAEAADNVILATSSTIAIQGDIRSSNAAARDALDEVSRGLAVITLQASRFTGQDVSITANDNYVMLADESQIVLRDSDFNSYRWGISTAAGALHLDNVTATNLWTMPPSRAPTLGSHFLDRDYGTGIIRVEGTDTTVLNSSLSGGRLLTILAESTLFAKNNNLITDGNVLLSRECSVTVHYNNLRGALTNDAPCELDLRFNNRTGDSVQDQGQFRFEELAVPIEHLPQTTYLQEWTRDGTELILSGYANASHVRIAGQEIVGGEWQVAVPSGDVQDRYTPLACDAYCGIPWDHAPPRAPFVLPPVAIGRIVDGQMDATLSYSPMDAKIVEYTFTYSNGTKIHAATAPVGEGSAILTVTDDIGLRSEPITILFAPVLDSRDAPMPLAFVLLALLIARRV